MKTINVITTALIILFNTGMAAKIVIKAISIMHSGHDESQIREEIKTLKNSIIALIIVFISSSAGILLLSYFSKSLETA